MDQINRRAKAKIYRIRTKFNGTPQICKAKIHVSKKSRVIKTIKMLHQRHRKNKLLNNEHKWVENFKIKKKTQK